MHKPGTHKGCHYYGRNFASKRSIVVAPLVGARLMGAFGGCSKRSIVVAPLVGARLMGARLMGALGG